MKKKLGSVILTILIVGMFFLPKTVLAAHESWNHVVDDMEKILKQSVKTFEKGDLDQARIEVDQAYFGHYEKLGFEKTVMSYISGKRASIVEYQFSTIKKSMKADAPKGQVKSEVTELISLLREDANKLDGKKESKLSVFLSSLVIITREGFEAILIVGVIVAYLRKTKNQDKLKYVYWGVGLALVSSVIMAFLLNSLSAITGANQEIIEGLTMLLAVVVMFHVSNWMIGKADADAWSGYIKEKVDTSIAKGSIFSLAFTAFLAVFREGAETILFYQALLSGTKEYPNLIWIGFGVGCLLLVVIYLAIRFLSIRIPMKPFFVGTSLLLFIMTVTFLGNGIKELQEGNLISATMIDGVTAVPLLGIYPTLETLIPQIILVVITIGTIVYQTKKWQKK